MSSDTDKKEAAKGVLRNTLIHGVASIAGVASMFLLHILAARTLGVADYGVFAFALAFTYLFGPLTDPGLYYLLIRNVARERESTQRLLGHALSWKLLAIIPAVFTIILVAKLIGSDGKTLTAVSIMAGALVLNCLGETFRPILIAYEKFGVNAFCQLFERALLLALALVVLLQGHGLIALCWVFIGVKAVNMVVMGLIVWFHVTHFRLGTDLSFVKQLVFQSIPIGAYYITLNFYSYVDTVMLAAIRGDQEVGWYTAGYKLYEGFMILPVILGTVLMPRVSRQYREDRSAFVILSETGIRLTVLLALFVCINGVLFSRPIIIGIYGDEFAPAVTALRILFLGMIFAFLVNLLQTILISIDRQKVVFYVVLSGLALNVLLNAMLIPVYGFAGAAWTTVIVEGLVLVALGGMAMRREWTANWGQILFLPVLVVGLCYVCLWSLTDSIWVRTIGVNLTLLAAVILIGTSNYRRWLPFLMTK